MMNADLIRAIIRAWLKTNDTIGITEVLEAITEELGRTLPPEIVKIIEAEFDPEGVFMH